MPKSLLTSEEWLKFKGHIDERFPEFFSALHAHGSLRPEKIKLCSLLLLDASTAEISERLKMSKHAVHLARIALSQKFKLEAPAELSLFLKQLAGAPLRKDSLAVQKQSPELPVNRPEFTLQFRALQDRISASEAIRSEMRHNLNALNQLIVGMTTANR